MRSTFKTKQGNAGSFETSELQVAEQKPPTAERPAFHQRLRRKRREAVRQPMASKWPSSVH